MFELNQDEFDKLSVQHQLYVSSLGQRGVKINLNSYNLEKLAIEDMSLTGSFITESIFHDNFFNNVEIFDATMCGCKFENVTFENVNFVKTDLSFCFFKGCKFINSKLKRCETYRAVYEDVQFSSCDLYDVFAYAELKNVVFRRMDLEKITLYETEVHDIKFIRDLNPQEERIVFKAIEEFREYGKSDIKCPICKGGLNYIGNNSSFAIECENCGVIYSLRGI